MKNINKQVILANVLGAMSFCLSLNGATSMVETPKKQYTVLNYNVCCSYNLYGTELDSKHRLPKIVQQIRNIDADVICLQEPRKEETEYLTKALDQMGYATISFSPTQDDKSMRVVTAYKRNVFVCRESTCWWYRTGDSSQPGGNQWSQWGRILTAVALYRVGAEKKLPLYVCNTHLGLDKDEKAFSVSLAMEIFKRKFPEKTPLVWCGDFNFFDDNPNERHRSLIAQAGFTDLIEDLRDTKGNEVAGTFVGYSTDKCAAKCLSSLDKLDGIFVRNIDGEQARCAIAVELAQNLESRDELPSDHLPIFTRITY